MEVQRALQAASKPSEADDETAGRGVTGSAAVSRWVIGWHHRIVLQLQSRIYKWLTSLFVQASL